MASPPVNILPGYLRPDSTLIRQWHQTHLLVELFTDVGTITFLAVFYFARFPLVFWNIFMHFKSFITGTDSFGGLNL